MGTFSQTNGTRRVQKSTPRNGRHHKARGYVVSVVEKIIARTKTELATTLQCLREVGVQISQFLNVNNEVRMILARIFVGGKMRFPQHNP